MSKENLEVLKMRNIQKTFPGVVALSGVDFTLRKGEIHALMGENGAGKSTLIKVLTGVEEFESGQILIDGIDHSVINKSPQEAQMNGISTVYQEINLCPNLSVAENIFIGREPKKAGRIDWKLINSKAKEILKGFDIDIDVTKSLDNYSVAMQQMVAIARAIDITSKILILDEPTSSLDENEGKKLFNVIIDEEFVNKLKSKAKVFYEKLINIKIKKISTSGVEFGDGEILDYAIAFEKLVKDLDMDKKLIIMLDEFAQTVENIIKYEDEKSAQTLLKTHRQLRQNPKISEKVTFVYAGSIGLESVVSKIHATKLINDLNSIKVSPLSLDEAQRFAKQLCKSVGIEIDDATLTYLLNKIEWFIPFYIQLLIQELKSLSKKSVINNAMVEQAIEKALEHRNHFEHWQSKLKEAFEKNAYLFAKEVLNLISENQTMQSSEIMNIATKNSMNEDEAKEIIHTLVYDGYINNNDTPKTYRFNSPILRMWWYKNVAN